MSGAAAHVLLPSKLSDSQRNELSQFILLLSGSIEGTSFWIVGQPFSWYEVEPDEDELNIRVDGWSPKSTIGFCAHCRGVVSDAYLAMLVARTAEMFDGIIAFGGHISSFANDAAILTREGRYPHEHQNLLTANYLHQWVAHPNFAMAN
jgi:Family of unknown function (DUF6368)